MKRERMWENKKGEGVPLWKRVCGMDVLCAGMLLLVLIIKCTGQSDTGGDWNQEAETNVWAAKSTLWEQQESASGQQEIQNAEDESEDGESEDGEEEAKKIALTFEDDVIIGLRKEAPRYLRQ